MEPDDGEAIFAKADALSARAIDAFKPRTPITTKELFAGRWSELTTAADAVKQPGLHVVIYGERGVGKTSLANVVGPTIWATENMEVELHADWNYRLVIRGVAYTDDTFSTLWRRIFNEVRWPGNGSSGAPEGTITTAAAFGLKEEVTIDEVRHVLSVTNGGVFIIDEFDQAAPSVSKSITELIKALSDFSADCTIVLVGISDTVDRLLAGHASIPRAVVQVKVERMKADELKLILVKAEHVLGIRFTQDASNMIVHLSQGLPHYTHLIGLHSVRSAASRLSVTTVERMDVFNALKTAVKQAEQSVGEKHATATYSSHSNSLHRRVLLACAVAASRYRDPLGYFTPSSVIAPLENILHKRVKLANFTDHLFQFCDLKRGCVLERDGQPWGYRYRFSDPLLVPYIFMDGIESKLTDDKALTEMLGQQDL
jgi:hypothetical protein